MKDSAEELRLALDPFREMAMFEDYNLVFPESAGMDGDTPLHVAAMEGRISDLLNLIRFAKNLNVAGDLGNTPLHLAILFDQLESAKVLIAHGASARCSNIYGDTPSAMMETRPLFEDLRKMLCDKRDKLR